jgi:predicted Zn-dependent protease
MTINALTIREYKKTRMVFTEYFSEFFQSFHFILDFYLSHSYLKNMLGEAKLKELTDKVLKRAAPAIAQVSIYSWKSGLTRFALSSIHQNVTEENVVLTVKCAIDNQIGEASTNDLTKIERTVRKAKKIAHISPPNPEFHGFPEPKPVAPIDIFFPTTYEFSPLKRAEICYSIINRASGVQAFGSFLTAGIETCIANSSGVFVYNRSTSALINTTIMDKTGVGRTEAGARDATNIDYKEITEKAIAKAKLAQNPIKIEPGRYDVILEELAVAELIEYLNIGFNALRYQEGRSPFCGKLGTKVMGDNISIWDDGLDEEGAPFPFDFEGTPKQKVMLIENGVIKGLVYDHNTAKKENKESTGHSIGSITYGPMALNLFMKGGNSSIEEMISSTIKGILVTRFWYSNLIDPMTLTITGMTRDGTFLIENGEIKKAVKNLRFTQSVIEALSKVEALSSPKFVAQGETYNVPFLFGSKVPALKIKDWNFTGVSEH